MQLIWNFVKEKKGRTTSEKAQFLIYMKHQTLHLRDGETSKIAF